MQIREEAKERHHENHTISPKYDQRTNQHPLPLPGKSFSSIQVAKLIAAFQITRKLYPPQNNNILTVEQPVNPT